jgi:SAM-dependent methyltransferase
MPTVTYEQVVADALATPFEGWDWSAFRGRFDEDRPSWDYRAVVREHADRVGSMLDLGTGGGELLAALAPLPTRTVATEGYAPNVAVARRRLEPLGVEVVDTTALGDEQEPLPFPSGSVELVINRHESYAPREVHRILAPGGWFVMSAGTPLRVTCHRFLLTARRPPGPA